MTGGPRVWIAQCLCPKRHCILASAAEVDDEDQAQTLLIASLRAGVATLLSQRGINPWCGLCRAKSETWRIEVSPTLFQTLDEAASVLGQLEAEQAIARAVLGDLGQLPN